MPKNKSTIFLVSLFTLIVVFGLNVVVEGVASGLDENLWSTEVFDKKGITPTGQILFVPSDCEAQTTSESIISLAKINDHLYQTEHSLFLIDTDHRINWPDYYSLFYDNLNYYLNELKAHYPEDFFLVTIMANNLIPDYSPRYNANRYKGEGIGFTGDTGVPDICRYNLPDVSSFDLGLLGVFDHEIGHAWGVAIEPSTQGGPVAAITIGPAIQLLGARWHSDISLTPIT